MKTRSRDLGWAIAHHFAAPDYQSSEYSKEEISCLDEIAQCIRMLNSDGRKSAILDTLPEISCSFDQPYLTNNHDFLLAFFSKSEHSTVCHSLSKHLNDCYHCFEVFSQVLRDYHAAREDLILSNKGNTDD